MKKVNATAVCDIDSMVRDANIPFYPASHPTAETPLSPHHAAVFQMVSCDTAVLPLSLDR